MFRSIRLTYSVYFSLGLNHFLYYFKKLPFIGRRVSNDVFRFGKTKVFLRALIQTLKIILETGLSAAGIFLFVLLPMIIREQPLTHLPLLMHHFFFAYFIFVPVLTNTIMQSRDLKAYTMVHLFRLEAKKYFLSQLAVKLSIKAVRYALLILIGGAFLGLTFQQRMILYTYVVAMAMVWEGIILKIYYQWKWDLFQKPVGLFLILVSAIGLSGVLPYLDILLPFALEWFRWPFVVGVLGLAVIALLFLVKNEHYDRLAKEIVTREQVFKQVNAIKDARFADVNVEEKKMNLPQTKGNEELDGYDYLHDLFQKRHQSILLKPLKIRIYIVLGISIAVIGLLFIHPTAKNHAPDVVKALQPAMIFGMYLLNTGERLSRALFFNCDRYMLKEGYYKEPKAILTNFTLRLKMSIKHNFIPAAILSVTLIGIGGISGMQEEWYVLALMIGSLHLLALFFSTHYLFLYYMLQPYTVELTSKSPLFSIINFLVYLISYVFLQVRTTSIVFTIGIVAFTLLYVGIALAVTYKFAPRTFRLK
ncbi:MAG TPA: hypothetical protein DHN33_04245 [Eubacteriaceae bacterium]|nr:hypothetical protein [Eubacteriaceae bacterium]